MMRKPRTPYAKFAPEILGVRLTSIDMARLHRLAELEGKRPSALAREELSRALGVRAGLADALMDRVSKVLNPVEPSAVSEAK